MATATLAYTVTLQPPNTNDQLKAALEAVPLPTDDLKNIGATLASDTTTQPTSTTCERTLVFTLSATFTSMFPSGTNQKAPFRNYFTSKLARALTSNVDAADPVIA